MVLLTLVALFVTIGTSVFLYIKWLDTYWERKGVFTYRPKNEVGNIALETYKVLKSRGLKYGAFSRFYKSVFMTTDLDVIKAILIKNTDHFVNRGMYSNPKVDPFSATLPALENEVWKNVRNIVSPIFSSGKFLWKMFIEISNKTF